MDPITQQTTLAAAGGKKDPVYVDDVFSTYLYTGNATARSINNGIDLAGEGGLVWIKDRNVLNYNSVIDTERGVNKVLSTSRNNAELTSAAGTDLTSFNANGFSLSATDNTHSKNLNTNSYASWTFRKAPGFFDVVTYTGTGSARTVAHSLGSVPGMIIVKRTNSGGAWAVWHRSLPNANSVLFLNETVAYEGQSTMFNSTTPTSASFTVGTSGLTNGTGDTFVAYIFAHDDAQFGTDGDQSIIKCGSYTGTAATGNFVNLGFEPQWVMVKSYTPGNAQPWFMFDNMRGTPSGGNDAYLLADSSSDEAEFEIITFNPTGFSIEATGDGTNGSGQSYIYMAIRRPNKPPEAATDVFALHSQTVPQNSWTPGFVPDSLIFDNYTNSGYDRFWASRLQSSAKWLYTNTTDGEPGNTTAYFHWDDPTNTIRQNYYQGGSASWINYAFKRAPGFFDVVTYSGNGTTGLTVAHNLETKPELMIVKKRNGAADWWVYNEAIGATKHLYLNGTSGANTTQWAWNNTEPTATQFTVGDDNEVNANGGTYITYLFATLPGISKVGSYAGTGNPINIDCGFTNGARFVLIKRSNGSGNWLLFDTTRGINAGSNDPYLVLNSNAGQENSYNIVEPYSSGFSVTTSAFVNDSDKEFIFLAIA